MPSRFFNVFLLCRYLYYVIFPLGTIDHFLHLLEDQCDPKANNMMFRKDLLRSGPPFIFWTTANTLTVPRRAL